MDLDYHDRSDLAAIFLDEYCLRTGDASCAELVDFYKINRAFVRGKVASLQLLEHEIPAEDRAAARDRARAYFRLARGYVIRRNLPVNLIMVGGMMGSGKSSVSRIIGRELGLQVVSSDRLRKELYSNEASGLPFGVGIYSPEADATTYQEMLVRCLDQLRKGVSVVADATFRRLSDRIHFTNSAKDEGVGSYLLMTLAPESIIRERLIAREANPDRYSDGRIELFEQHRYSFEMPNHSCEIFYEIPTSGSPWDAADAVYSALGILP
jgi:predicted kinase